MKKILFDFSNQKKWWEAVIFWLFYTIIVGFIIALLSLMLYIITSYSTHQVYDKLPLIVTRTIVFTLVIIALNVLYIPVIIVGHKILKQKELTRKVLPIIIYILAIITGGTLGIGGWFFTALLTLFRPKTTEQEQ